MYLKKVKSVIPLTAILLSAIIASAQLSEKEDDDDALQLGLEILKRYFYQENNWYVAKPAVANNVRGLINFIEDDPIDSVIGNIYKSLSNKQTYVFRLPENVEDSLTVPGYFSQNRVQERLKSIELKLQKDFQNRKTAVPAELLSNLENKLNLIPQGKGMQLFTRGMYKMPGELQIPEVIPDSVLNSAEMFERLVHTDSIRTAYIEKIRVQYNDSLVAAYTDSVKTAYADIVFDKEYEYQVKRLSDSVKVNNYNVLRMYNESVVNAVNDSISAVLRTMAEYADFIDSTKISLYNLSGNSSELGLNNGSEKFTRLWLKNVQHDSLSVMVRSVGKRGIFMLIDDGATISRFKPKEKKEFDFSSLEKSIASLNTVGKAYEIETPWRIGGEGNVGFSQTYLSNWKKGGQSAISSLILLKGFANYKRADGLVKWDNFGEFRNGWIRPGGNEEQLQKNDDKFELTSRFGVSAFKKWYYSAEFNFETQFFRGYRYPRQEAQKPISAFLAPSRMFFKVGLEYKPNKDFSLLLSPFTIKNVYVRDTLLIDQTKFGVDAHKKSFWEPGLNADIFLRKPIRENITYETKYKMFINYKAPFEKFDINWENAVVAKLTYYTDVRFMMHLIYDDDVLFPVYDSNNVQTGTKTKLQLKEFFSIGFTYKINHNVMRSKRLR